MTKQEQAVKIERSDLIDRSAFVSGQKLLDGCNTHELLAWMIKCEAGDQPLSGKVAVACVPLERVECRPWRYGSDLRSAILKPQAFSCFDDLDWAARFWPVDPEYLTLARLAAADLLHTPAPGATHYYNPKINTPYWAPLFEHVAAIGDHIFKREPS